MQKDEVVEFLGKIDSYLAGKQFQLKIIGKSALLLSGFTDSVGTVDIDSLAVDGKHQSDEDQKTTESLLAEFGRARVAVNGYYLEFVAPAIVFLPQKPKWVSFEQKFDSLSVEYLEPTHVVASKLFSAFSSPPRKRDKQDIAAAFDQKLVALQDALNIVGRSHSLFNVKTFRRPFDNFAASGCKIGRSHCHGHSRLIGLEIEEEFIRVLDSNVHHLLQREQILVSRHDVAGFSRDRAIDEHVVLGVPAKPK